MYWICFSGIVSTHSHPKVAASENPCKHTPHCSFNTQPPEGGCLRYRSMLSSHSQFQHTATRRWLLKSCIGNFGTPTFQHTATRRWLLLVTDNGTDMSWVSTHSHPKVAATLGVAVGGKAPVSTHSHPKVAAGFPAPHYTIQEVSTHSHPKVAASSVLPHQHQ